MNLWKSLQEFKPGYEYERQDEQDDHLIRRAVAVHFTVRAELHRYLFREGREVDDGIDQTSDEDAVADDVREFF